MLINNVKRILNVDLKKIIFNLKQKWFSFDKNNQKLTFG
jgi:hypothetical protein